MCGCSKNDHSNNIDAFVVLEYIDSEPQRIFNANGIIYEATTFQRLLRVRLQDKNILLSKIINGVRQFRIPNE